MPIYILNTILVKRLSYQNQPQFEIGANYVANFRISDYYLHDHIKLRDIHKFNCI